MIRCCIVDTKTKRVVNIIDYEAAPVSTPPGMADGLIAVASDSGQIGYTFNGKTFADPNPAVVPAPPVLSKSERLSNMLAAHGLTVADLKSEIAK